MRGCQYTPNESRQFLVVIVVVIGEPGIFEVALVVSGCSGMMNLV
jgi:hypothetical protein